LKFPQVFALSWDASDNNNNNSRSNNNTSFNLSFKQNESTTFIEAYALYLKTQGCLTQLNYLDDEVKLLSGGRLLLDDGIDIYVYEEGFCLENFYDPDSNEVYQSGFLCETAVVTLQFKAQNVREAESCLPSLKMEWMMKWTRFTFTNLGFVSLFFLILTLYFYLTLPELSNFQGHITIIYILSNILTIFLLILSYNVTLKLSDEAESSHEYLFIITKPMCQTLGYLLYFSGILMFSWMAVLSFDLFWTFAFTSIPLKNMETTRRFSTYLVCGFGGPSILLILVVLLVTISSTHVFDNSSKKLELLHYE